MRRTFLRLVPLCGSNAALCDPPLASWLYSVAQRRAGTSRYCGQCVEDRQSGRVMWRKAVMLFGFNVWNLGKHAVELLAAAARGPLADVAIRIQNGDLLGEGR